MRKIFNPDKGDSKWWNIATKISSQFHFSSADDELQRDSTIYYILNV